MANESVGSVNKGTVKSGLTASQKRSASKAINAEKMAKLTAANQYAIKTLRQASRTIDAAVECVLDGGNVDSRLIEACANLQIGAAASMFG